MKRIAFLFVAAMLISAPAFALPANGPSNITIQSSGTQPGTMENVSNKTTMRDSTIINNGKNNVTEVGNITNAGGSMKNVSNQTTMQNSEIINNGESNAARVGNISNQ